MCGMRRLLSLVASLSILAAACSSGATDDTTTPTDTDSAETSETSDAPGVRLVSADEAAEIQTNPPAELVILDIRTFDEFAAGHIDGATMLDFYGADFADQVAALDKDVPYLLYCRSGNRSAATSQMMSELGFADVAELDGGIISWDAAGLPFVTP